jgi:hypothetical protein
VAALEVQADSLRVVGTAEAPPATPIHALVDGQLTPAIWPTVEGAVTGAQEAPPSTVPTGTALPPTLHTSVDAQPMDRKERCGAGTEGTCGDQVRPPFSLRTMDCAGAFPTATQTRIDGHDTALNCVFVSLSA